MPRRAVAMCATAFHLVYAWLIRSRVVCPTVQKKKVDEYSRITTLVDRARTNDPRLKRAREAEQRAKLEAKEARLAQARQREDEERQKREEEAKVAEEQRKRNEEEKQVAKDALVKEKKAARKAKNLLRKLHADKVGPFCAQLTNAQAGISDHCILGPCVSRAGYRQGALGG